MLPRPTESLLIRPQDVTPSRDDLEVIGTFNPGVVAVGPEIVLLVRVAERPRRHREGLTALPRWQPGKGITIDWTPRAELEVLDPRVVRRRADGLVRLTFVSHLRVFRSAGGKPVEETGGPRFNPHAVWEEFGVEDPRITTIDGTCYFTYVAVSRHGAATALASTADFRSFRRHGIIFCPENKDVVLFPQRIGGRYCALHRPTAATPFTTPRMWIAWSPDLLHWGGHAPLAVGAADWASDRIGAGAPPICTPEGWLALYHGSRRSAVPGQVGGYSCGAMLLDPDNPQHVLRRSREPLLKPEAEFQRRGFVPNVVFPTGAVEREGTLRVYYGAADTFTAVAQWPRAEVLASLSSEGLTPAPYGPLRSQ